MTGGEKKTEKARGTARLEGREKKGKKGKRLLGSPSWFYSYFFA